MKKYTVSALCMASLFVSGIQSTFAESVAVQGNLAFIADNSVAGSQILVKNLPGGDANSCLANASLGLVDGTTATDILIKDNNAIVTTVTNATPPATGIAIVNVSSCTGNQTIAVEECITTLSGGVLTIPCVQYNGQIFTVELEQRGSSMNWELKSSPILNDTFAGYQPD